MQWKHFLDLKRYPIGIRRITTAGLESATDIVPLLQLKRDFPQLSNYNELASGSRRKLLPYYQDYVSRVSIDYMAISLELSAFLLVLCEVSKPGAILDLGSGFSSFVFRYYMSSATPKPIVWSVDDSSEWLERTRTFLMDYKVPSENMSTWSSFGQQQLDGFDLILDDLGVMEVRTATLKKVLTLARPAGTIILDDMQKADYASYVKQVLHASNCRNHNLIPYTRDKYGRYSILVTS